ncbi:tRNA (cytidine(34)-2'-O)-methyltransferase [Pseudobacteriovorax antillogorgiicola]|uniref:Putative tRNA (cytidine(34)-2'-O)-methyltransferase n=1 Tax=Pseudobacteriovorax antillogorgiicola TaxID=1513793 RepID=A0A1Y6BUJ8_9BACT|nr:tRNA (cytidine(34)-2'-O)-methyltransferase [Pseudobacteriovorax antillogorgiicola]TCS53807.1 tRNA (cytidine/uridine-2'-O-)-methyltransferase [Pseudobacteriovorax antillogorgiicola]SMF22057.1 tRNA (cytidine/uridine-2'-O-)-methyltransferase [Pseudobacteriovorax antillogorgiicola]
MRQGHPQICLFQPEIPQNTGNIGRLAAATACRLHLVKPFGFSMSDKNLRRPGLDYWPCLDLEIHDQFESVYRQCHGKVAFFTKFADADYTQVPEDTELLVFGQETSGLPESFHETYAHQLYRIPMFHPEVRSLNLSNAVSIIVYDQLRKRGLLH